MSVALGEFHGSEVIFITQAAIRAVSYQQLNGADLPRACGFV